MPVLECDAQQRRGAPRRRVTAARRRPQQKGRAGQSRRALFSIWQLYAYKFNMRLTRYYARSSAASRSSFRIRNSRSYRSDAPARYASARSFARCSGDFVKNRNRRLSRYMIGHSNPRVFS
ncbi:hypothetical protein DP43_5580 [Burkholderia pseudomallei]|nr:hypothetical protein DP43_5580 [Burkholderia pseudomallei]